MTRFFQVGDRAEQALPPPAHQPPRRPDHLSRPSPPPRRCGGRLGRAVLAGAGPGRPRRVRGPHGGERHRGGGRLGGRRAGRSASTRTPSRARPGVLDELDLSDLTDTGWEVTGPARGGRRLHLAPGPAPLRHARRARPAARRRRGRGWSAPRLRPDAGRTRSPRAATASTGRWTSPPASGASPRTPSWPRPSRPSPSSCSRSASAAAIDEMVEGPGGGPAARLGGVQRPAPRPRTGPCGGRRSWSGRCWSCGPRAPSDRTERLVWLGVAAPWRRSPSCSTCWCGPPRGGEPAGGRTPAQP